MIKTNKISISNRFLSADIRNDEHLEKTEILLRNLESKFFLRSKNLSFL